MRAETLLGWRESRDCPNQTDSSNPHRIFRRPCHYVRTAFQHLAIRIDPQSAVALRHSTIHIVSPDARPATAFTVVSGGSPRLWGSWRGHATRLLVSRPTACLGQETTNVKRSRRSAAGTRMHAAVPRRPRRGQGRPSNTIRPNFKYRLRGLRPRVTGNELSSRSFIASNRRRRHLVRTFDSERQRPLPSDRDDF